MNEESAQYRKIECPQCGWKTLLDFQGVFDWLVKYRILKRNRGADDEIVYELFHAMTERYSCPECGAKNLRYRVMRDDFSDTETRRCLGCRTVIPPERTVYFPDVKYCAACAQKLERGEALPVRAEYCPVCGKMMSLVEVREGRRTVWQWVCTTVPSCRYLESGNER
ncbi:MAG: TraR/DksA C4-type zinc finger protein [Thermoguttaceae bacterium]|nr:TraR/DksA C4-type zinc finger protein [Thermoguttaceae bacterium]